MRLDIFQSNIVLINLQTLYPWRRLVFGTSQGHANLVVYAAASETRDTVTFITNTEVNEVLLHQRAQPGQPWLNCRDADQKCHMGL